MRASHDVPSAFRLETFGTLALHDSAGCVTSADHGHYGRRLVLLTVVAASGERARDGLDPTDRRIRGRLVGLYILTRRPKEAWPNLLADHRSGFSASVDWPSSMSVPRVLIHLDHNPHPRVFDSIMSIDGGAEHVLTHGDVDPQDVPLLVSGALYSRSLEELARTAILITGTNDRVIEEMVRQARRAFFGRYRVSLMSECKGGNAVAGAAVARMSQLISLGGVSAVVIGGGPVGARVAGLLSAAGARVLLSVFDAEEAEERRRFVQAAFDQGLETVVWKSGDAIRPLIEDARIVVTAGPPGLLLLPRAAWASAGALELLADVSGAEPPGIEGIVGEEDGEGRPIQVLGGLAISRHKILVHREAVRRLFESDTVILGPREIAAIAREVV